MPCIFVQVTLVQKLYEAAYLIKRNKDKRTQIQETKTKSSKNKVFFLHNKDYSFLSFAAVASYHLNHYNTSTPHCPYDLTRSSDTHSKYHQHPQSLLPPYAKALQIPIVTASEFSPLQDRCCCCCLEEIVSCLANQQQVQAGKYCGTTQKDECLTLPFVPSLLKDHCLFAHMTQIPR